MHKLIFYFTEFEKCRKNAEFELHCHLLGVNTNLCNRTVFEHSQHCQAVHDMLGCCNLKKILLSDSCGSIWWERLEGNWEQKTCSFLFKHLDGIRCDIATRALAEII